ncbi:probable zinc metalloprotease EGY1, chloroplastic isoform X1 [Camellia sinensis]|uniref:probable zinc metalloprotease EGY1, chloroplastic isoform X1 n=1 Tax=Camellia sinensis TaxID=4442 RepID=UPI001035C7CE|nr:probable zinc metalloprotease EGY1, chloroplastic isoform X1 [Camellia sinensis]
MKIEKTLIKKKLFGYSTLWVTKEEPFGDLGEGILFLGNLRGKREEVFPNFRVSWLNSWAISTIYLWWRNPILKDQTRGGPRVSFGMLGKEVSEPGPATLRQYVIALLLFVLTIGSSVELGIASQEVGHFFAAFPKKVKLSIPFFIPNITLGSFGAITQFKSILLDQKTKVDISFAVPFAGATLSFSMFAVGLLLSSNPNAAGDLVQVPSMLFQGSLLLGLISRATLGYAANAYSHSLGPSSCNFWLVWVNYVSF